MNLEQLQQTETETELPICVGSPLVGKTEKEIVEEFGVEIKHTHFNPEIRKENRYPYSPEQKLEAGLILHITGKHEQIDNLMQSAF